MNRPNDTTPLFQAANDEPTITIGAVCEALRADYPDISISKIRYLEDQRLISPRRTPGGYRLYTNDDLERLRTILRLQRDEFLPLRVIRQELDDGGAASFSGGGIAKHARRPQLSDPAAPPRHSIDYVLALDGASRELVRELQEYGLVRSGEAFDDTERELVQAAAELSSHGVQPRHLRLFRTAAEREAGLLEQLLATGLRSRNPERRREALDTLEHMAGLVSHIRHLMLVAELRPVAHPESGH